MSDDTDPFGSGVFGATKMVAQKRDSWEKGDLASHSDASHTSSTKKGDFQFPDRCVDLFGLFLDEDIRYARQEMFDQIENNQIGSANQPMTQPARLMQKTVVTIQAINKQAERDRHKQRTR
jgi:hypothetical protein